jgi:hypothetical protein
MLLTRKMMKPLLGEMKKALVRVTRSWMRMTKRKRKKCRSELDHRVLPVRWMMNFSN